MKSHLSVPILTLMTCKYMKWNRHFILDIFLVQFGYLFLLLYVSAKILPIHPDVLSTYIYMYVYRQDNYHSLVLTNCLT